MYKMYSNLIIILLLSFEFSTEHLCVWGGGVYCSSDMGLLRRKGSRFNILDHKHSAFRKVASNLRKWLISFFLLEWFPRKPTYVFTVKHKAV